MQYIASLIQMVAAQAKEKQATILNPPRPKKQM